MPDINKIDVPLYSADQPYHWEYDNLPLKALISRQELINNAVDRVSDLVRASAGSQGSLENRLNQSLDEDGNLKTSSIDEKLHNIGAHTDGIYEDVEYVRMLAEERDKLTRVADDATNVTVAVEDVSAIILFDEGKITLMSSDSVAWQVLPGSIIKANLTFPLAAAHRHYYNIVPITSDYSTFLVNVAETAYVDGSLRVFINGVRLSSEMDVYVPGNLMSEAWSLNGFVSDAENGSFTLNQTITEDDHIIIDFDVSLV